MLDKGVDLSDRQRQTLLMIFACYRLYVLYSTVRTVCWTLPGLALTVGELDEITHELFFLSRPHSARDHWLAGLRLALFFSLPSLARYDGIPAEIRIQLLYRMMLLFCRLEESRM